MNPQDFPAFLIEADNISLRAQRLYLALIKADLALLVGSVLVACFQPDSHSNWLQWHAWFIAVIAFLGLLTTSGIWYWKLERTWFEYRAVAESIKQLVWKYMMCVDPFPHILNLDDSKKVFIASLSEVLNETQSQLTGISDTNATKQLTKTMIDVRSRPLNDRLSFYQQHRLLDQHKWYANKSKHNREVTMYWFCCIVAAQAMSLLYAISRILCPGLINITGFFAALATAFISWLQIKRHQDLSQSYAIAAKELNLINEGAELIHDEAALDRFVMNAEAAISREHTLWIAKRILNN